MNGVGLAVMDRDNINAKKLEPLIDCGHVFLIARYAIKRFDNYNVKLIALCVREKPQEAIAFDHRRARLGAVIIRSHDLKTPSLCKIPAKGDLIVNGAIRLQFCTETSIKGCAANTHIQIPSINHSRRQNITGSNPALTAKHASVFVFIIH
ncbi:hypothetical protein NO134_12625 [Ochrobactrum sp. BD22]|nr:MULTISPECIES: hypothetical protein [unclassified Ochrobactrum]